MRLDKPETQLLNTPEDIVVDSTVDNSCFLVLDLKADDVPVPLADKIVILMWLEGGFDPKLY